MYIHTPYIAHHILKLILVFCIVLFITSCSLLSAEKKYQYAELPETSQPPETLLTVGDELQVEFNYWPEFGIKTIRIRPDGKIALPTIGTIMAAGLTPEQLNVEITKQYSSILKKPDITVNVLTSSNQRIYVGGEVWAPQQLALRGNMTALEAIMTAGGFRMDTAETSDVIIIRHTKNKLYIKSLNVQDTLGGENNKPFYLAAQDVIFVPRTKITQINQWIEQHLTKILTVSGFSFSYYPKPDWTFHVGD